MSTRGRSAFAVILLALLAGGCGQQQSSQRPAVAEYVKQVNTIEAALATPLASVASAGSQFSQVQRAGGNVLSQRPAGKSILTLGPSPEQTLQKAWIEIRALRTRLAAVRTPPTAERLRALLLELIDGQAAMTRQIAELVAFLPRYTAALGSLAPAIRRLETALNQRTAYGAAAVTAVFASKAAALRGFQSTTSSMLVRLRRLRPPPSRSPGTGRR